jgi:hypothetical protein
MADAKKIDPKNFEISQEEENQILEKLESQSKVLSKNPQREAVLTPPKTTNRLIGDILESKGMEVNKENIIRTKLTILAQEGATSPRFPETHSIDYYNIPLTVKEVCEACRKCNTTLKHLARALALFAVTAAFQYDIPGNLSKKYILDHPNCSIEELKYASDFLTFSNATSVPPEVRE